MDLSLVILHEGMVDKTGREVVSSLTPIDVHDIARSCRTYGVTTYYVAHPSPFTRHLARSLLSHWSSGFGADYNPNRTEALSIVDVAADLEEVVTKIEARAGTLPRLIATCAKRRASERISFAALRGIMRDRPDPFLLMVGTAWGMTDALAGKAEFFLEPIDGPGEFNHLSVRSASAVLLDRLVARGD